MKMNEKIVTKLVCRKYAAHSTDLILSPSSCLSSTYSTSPLSLYPLELSALLSTRKLRILWQISCLCSIKSIEAFNIANLSDVSVDYVDRVWIVDKWKWMHPQCGWRRCRRYQLWFPNADSWSGQNQRLGNL